MAHLSKISLILGLAAVLAGCEPEVRVIKPSFESLRQYADTKPENINPRDPVAGQGWAIQLARFDGPDRLNEARQWTMRLRQEQALPQVWFEDVGGTISLYCGRFQAAADPEARLALVHAQNFTLDDTRPFPDARLVPLVHAHDVALDPLDLKPYVGFFTLQVAVFTKDYAGNRREAAENYARQLRQQNEEAYFYHGPRNSSVTIGLFTHDDFARQGNTDVYGPRIRELQQRYPHNVVDNHRPNPQIDPPESIQVSRVVRVL